jgi:superfamily II DNA or RNA helicase
MTGTYRGLYETLITEALESLLGDLDGRLVAERKSLGPPEAGDRIALHLARVIQRAVDSIPDEHRSEKGAKLAREILELVQSSTKTEGLNPERPLLPGEVLHRIAQRLPDGSPEVIESPLIPLLDTTLLTNAPGEPHVGRQLLAEAQSADRIDVAMAFIRYSGVQPLREALRRHCEAGRELRVLTTTYTGTTEESALELLQRLGAQLRVSYDTTGTRLHAKAWLFYRKSGFSTAYIGSSNLTHTAQVTGLEWNVRVSGARNPDVIDKMSAVFEAYWHNADFRPYQREEFRSLTQTQPSQGPTLFLPPTELRPEPFQERLLEQIAVARSQGFHRNLLVAATGTGKTVMAALDYARLRNELPRSRLLFVAHREEILSQSLATFRYALRDPGFGELWVAGNRPRAFEHVFASIQSLNASRITHVPRDYFDMLIVDEFHHAAAHSYRTLLEQVTPVELLGLTATPERSDGLPVLEWFGGRITAELRLWDAIEQQRLAPFLYFGIHDGLDLAAIPWRRGRGYDVEKLSNLVTGNEVLARLVIQELERRVGNLTSFRALGFCVSIAHARFMAAAFNAAGIPSVAIWSDSEDEERREALSDLASGRIRVVFSVDLFNEGVDVPAVDTLLMLRPTDSPTLFIQQLGRGLRKSTGKSHCTVLDFVGHHRKEFRFDRRFRALLGGTRQELLKQVEAGFPFLPAGCYLELDLVAKDAVLKSIRDAVPGHWRQKIEALQAAASDGDSDLQHYLDSSGLELEEVYSSNRSWSDLRQAAGLPVLGSGPHEERFRRAIGRLLHVDDMTRIYGYQQFLGSDIPPDPSQLPERQKRLLRMLVSSLLNRNVSKETSLHEGAELLWEHPQVLAELRELLDILSEQIEHVPIHLANHANVPLEIHASYTRIEMLAAFGVGEGATTPSWMTGVYWAKEAQADLLPFTLDKTSGQFSPRTRYRDYAIDRQLVHWESQSITRADSDTGRRYQQHAAMGTRIMLFARTRTGEDERAFYFLGPASYVKHESEQPMAITWRLEQPLPGDLFAAFAAAVA